MELVFALLLGWVGMSIAMSALWWYQLRQGDAGIVDVAWGLGVGLLGTLFCWLSEHGNPNRRLLLACLVLIWSLRLSAHIAARLRRMPEDGRYQSLRDDWGPNAQRRLFGFFQLQAFWSVLFALPIMFAASNPKPFPGLTDWAGLALWLLAVAGEAVADWQLQRFRMDSANRGQVCRTGFWYYSRHPNYFFEWLHWWVYPLLAVGAPGGGFALAGPLVMYWFLTRVTGIPPTEAQALRSRGAAYREYQATTNSFFPWFPREKRAI